MIEESYAITEQLDAIEGNTSDTVDLIDSMPESIARAIGTGITINAGSDEQSSGDSDNEGRSYAGDSTEDPDIVEVTVIVDSETGDIQPPASQSSDVERSETQEITSDTTDTTTSTGTDSSTDRTDSTDSTDSRTTTESSASESEVSPVPNDDASAEQSSNDDSQPEPEPAREITIDDIPLRDDNGRFRPREERESMAAEANANRREEQQQRSLVDSIRESVASGVGGLSDAGDTEEAAGYAVGGSIYGAALEVSSAVEELRSDDSLLGKGFKKVKKAFGGGGFMSLFRRNQEERPNDDAGSSDDSRAAGNEDVTDAISEQSEQIEEQTEETRKGFKDVVAAIKGIITGTGTGGDLIDSALDMFGGGDDRSGRGSRGGSGARGGGRLSRALGAARGIGGRALSVGGKTLGALAAPVAGFMAYSDKKEELESRTDITESQKSTQAVSTGVGAGGGALAGAAAGAAIGSVVPVLGTAIGGIIGGLLGAYGGEMLGSEAGKLISGDTASEEEKQYAEKKPEEPKRTPMEQALYDQGNAQAESKPKEMAESTATASPAALDAEQPLVQTSVDRVTAMPVNVQRATKEPEKQDPTAKAIAASLGSVGRRNGTAKAPLSSGDSMKPVVEELRKIGKLLGENPDKTESGSDNYINPNFSDPMVELMAHDRI